MLVPFWLLPLSQSPLPHSRGLEFAGTPFQRDRVVALAMKNLRVSSDRRSQFALLLRSTLLTCVGMLGLSGCASSLLGLSENETFSEKFANLMSNDARREKEEDNEFDTSTKIETPLLREYISVTGNNMIALRGVGLVVGLSGTGGDPPPSYLRKELQDEMTRMKIPNPSRVLADRNTALVMVTAYLPPMVREGDTFDVRVTLPPNSEATSLKGGTLLETKLSEERAVAGRGNLKGHQYGVARGAILTALGNGGKANAAMMRRGSIPGGAVSDTERNLEVILRNEHRGLKTSKRIETAISKRLHHYNRLGKRVPMAEAKTDLMLELKVHPTYRNNFPRYQQMIRSIAYKETDISRRLRMDRLAEDILKPEKAASAALQFEAIGREAIPFLIATLEADSMESRFHAAQALAYLEDSSGVDVLKKAALEESAFRVYALAALSVIDDADSIVALRKLIASDDLETRYGAVRAMKEQNPNDPILGTTNFDKQFVLHAIDAGTAAVHVVRYRSPEIVVFGSQQNLRVPASLEAGDRISVIGRAGDNTVTVTKYQLNKDSERKVVSTNLVEIINALAEFGAKYPDIVQMLVEADSNGNLIGEFGIDRLPQAGRKFRRKSSDGDSERDAKLGTPSLTPGLFDRLEESEQHTPDEEQSTFARLFTFSDHDSADTDETIQTADLSDGKSSTEEASIPSDADQQDDESIDAEQIRSLNLAETATVEETYDDETEDVVIEQTEFKEPLSSKLRRTFLSPFKRNN